MLRFLIMPKNKKSGFLLIEVLIAVTILSVGLVILIQSMANCLHQNETTLNLGLATLLGYQELCVPQKGSYMDEFQAKTSTEKITDNLDKISINISWKEHSEERSLQFESFKAKK